MRRSVFLFFGLLIGPLVGAVEIPVRRGGGEAGTTVGFVDMDLIFREYPETKKARDDYQKEVDRFKTELENRERSVGDLRREVDKLKPNASPAGGSMEAVSVSSIPALSTPLASSPEPTTPDMFSVPKGTSPVAPSEVIVGPSVAKAVPSADLAKQEELLKKREQDLEDARASAAQALKNFEADRSRKVLGRLYKALVQLADERGIDLVVDKSAILYGQDAIDLTDALNRRVRGLPPL